MRRRKRSSSKELVVEARKMARKVVTSAKPVRKSSVWDGLMVETGSFYETEVYP